jgi:hypothetical protein
VTGDKWKDVKNEKSYRDRNACYYVRYFLWFIVCDPQWWPVVDVTAVQCCNVGCCSAGVVTASLRYSQMTEVTTSPVMCVIVFLTSSKIGRMKRNIRHRAKSYCLCQFVCLSWRMTTSNIIIIIIINSNNNDNSNNGNSIIQFLFINALSQQLTLTPWSKILLWKLANSQR